MIVSQFEAWARTASPPDRADGVSALARAYLYSNLDAGQRRDAVRALTGFLDDPSPLVRRALADAFASAADAPHPIVLALADDLPSIASIVLTRSPILSDADLADCASGASDVVQCAIAARVVVSEGLAAALIAVGQEPALAVLSGNPGASLTDDLLHRLARQNGASAAIREALLSRGALPVDVRSMLVAHTAVALSAFVAGRAWLPADRVQRIAREASDKAMVTIAADEGFDHYDGALLAAQLRAAGCLTVALMLRAVLSGNLTLFNAMLCELSGMAAARVAGLTVQCESAGFAALYRRANLPTALLPAFRIALAAVCDGDDAGTPALRLDLVSHVRARCGALNEGQFDDLLVLLRRFEVEAAREDARRARSTPVEVVSIAPAVTQILQVETEDALIAAATREEARFDREVRPARDRITPVSITVDMAAIEAELLAA